ncbi:MAG: ABC transporter ATP-binding protein/permease [Firmicutes bacterium]|uniref:ABC transporter n=1 Tax=Sulfobacillus benefaciens TaxID=453960 RepID=A0A2T2WY08_9FIRM|nr:ABC transporter ATP-binding protein/permease [Bacillota bacterium]MCL5015327.1 ABC transporter ATP-binding protein/permease [Bacillota bacterium]PSR27112.1 MAG: ABC transporter [Sulfobacillus benefaciens]
MKPPERQRPLMPMMGGGWGRNLGIPAEKPKNFQATAGRLMRYFLPYKWPLVFVVISTILGTGFSILGPRIMGNITTKLYQGLVRQTHGTGNIDFAAISHLLAILSGLYILSAAFTYFPRYIMAHVAQKSIYDLRQQLDHKLTLLPVSYFDTHAHGDILSRFVNDFDNISSSLQQSLTQIIQAIVTFVGVLVMMVLISPIMTITVALTLPLSFYFTRVIARRSQKFFLWRQTVLGELNGHIEEMYTGHQVVKAFSREPEAISRFTEINQRLYEATWKAQFITSVIMPVMNFISNLGYVFVSVVGGILVTLRRIQIGDILAFIQYSRQFSQPITQLSSISNVIQSAIASAERVFEVLDAPEETEIAEPRHLAHITGSIQFDHVSFGYTPNHPVINDLTLDIESGHTVAIVGETGAGKTTLVNLLMHFYDVTEGSIRIDGVDIRFIPRRELHHLLGMVLQDTWLFHGTIRDNIAYGKTGASEEEIIAAAKTAQVHHFVQTLPEGYDTVLNEEAANISAGQKQLLTIARAILADPPILILDEATSSVDTRTEVLIQRAMDHLMRGRTSLVIAHRLSTIQDANRIVVMDQGRIHEEGTHTELLKRQGIYWRLYRSQYAHQEEVSL